MSQDLYEFLCNYIINPHATCLNCVVGELKVSLKVGSLQVVHATCHYYLCMRVCMCACMRLCVCVCTNYLVFDH